MKSSLQVFIFDVFSKGLLGVISIALIRFMPESEYALYIFAVSLVAIVTQALAISFNRIYIVSYRSLSLQDNPASFLGFQLMVMTIVVVLTLPLANSMANVYWFAAALILATCLSEFAKTTFQRELKFVKFSIVELARSLAFASGVLILLYSVSYDAKTWQVLSIQATAVFFVFIIAFHRRLDIRKLLRVGEALSLVFTVIRGRYIYLFGYFFLLAFFAQVSVLTLSFLSSDQDLATFGSAFRYASLLALALASVQAVLLPLVQKAQDVAELEAIFAEHKKTVVLFVLLVLFGMWISQWVIPWIDLGKYPEAVLVFRVLAVSTIIGYIFSPHVNLVLRFEDFKFLFVLICVALIVSIGLNVLLVSLLGAVGAAIATVISAAGVSSSQFIRARQRMQALRTVQQGTP